MLLDDLISHYGLDTLIRWEDGDKRIVSQRGVTEIMRLIEMERWPAGFPMELVDANGKFATRFSKWYGDFFPKKLSPHIIAKIGTIADNNAAPADVMWFDFYPGVLRYADNGGRGFFRSPGSCYYTDYSQSPPNLEALGSITLRVFEPGGGPGRNFHDNFTGAGRAWLTPVDEGILVTNIYYVNDNRRLITLLSSVLSKIQPVPVTFDEVDTEIAGVYTNNETGFYLRRQDARKKRSISLEPDEVWRGGQCTSCRRPLAYAPGKPRSYCDKCGARCEKCGDDNYYFAMHYVHDLGGWFCKKHLVGKNHCDKCGKLYASHVLCEHEGEEHGQR